MLLNPTMDVVIDSIAKKLNKQQSSLSFWILQIRLTCKAITL